MGKDGNRDGLVIVRIDRFRRAEAPPTRWDRETIYQQKYASEQQFFDRLIRAISIPNLLKLKFEIWLSSR